MAIRTTPVPTPMETLPGAHPKWTDLVGILAPRWTVLLMKSLGVPYIIQVCWVKMLGFVVGHVIHMLGSCDEVHDGLCEFPFNYHSSKGMTQCLQSPGGYKWCATAVNETNDYIGEWISCRGPHCREQDPVTPETGNLSFQNAFNTSMIMA